MVPPALTEVWENMLPWKLDQFINYMPHVAHPYISDDKWSEEPVAPMDKVVVIKVVIEILPCEFTIIIISVEARCDLNI